MVTPYRRYTKTVLCFGVQGLFWGDLRKDYSKRRRHLTAILEYGILGTSLDSSGRPVPSRVDRASLN